MMSRTSAAVLLLALPAASGLVPASFRPPAQTASRAGWCGLCQAPQAPPRGSTGDAESDAEVARRRAEYLESLTPEERQKRQVGLAKRLSADISGQRRDVIKRKGKRTERKTAAAGRGFGVQRSLKYDRRPKPSAPCGCGSDQSYADCCLPQHESGVCTDPEPAALVRARYTAYLYRLPDFLMATTDPKGDEYQHDAAAWKKSLLQFCDQIDFRRLEVERAEPDADPPAVSFRVSFVQKGTINLCDAVERSEFARRDGKWLYTRGDVRYEAPRE